jgi:hypothetical protein
MPHRRRSTSRDRSVLREAARGTGYIVALGLVICLLAVLVAAGLVAAMT